MEENVIQINSEIMINTDASVKNIAYMKKIIFGILLHLVTKVVNIQNYVQGSCVTKLLKNKQQQLQQMKKSNLQNKKYLISFT